MSNLCHIKDRGFWRWSWHWISALPFTLEWWGQFPYLWNRITQFVNLDFVSIWGWVILCRGGCPVCCRMFSSIPGLHLLDANSTTPSSVMTIKNVSRYFCVRPISVPCVKCPCAVPCVVTFCLCSKTASSWELVGWHCLLGMYQTSSLVHLEHTRHPINADSPSSLIHPALSMLQVDGLNGAVTLGFSSLGWKCHELSGCPHDALTELLSFS